MPRSRKENSSASTLTGWLCWKRRLSGLFLTPGRVTRTPFWTRKRVTLLPLRARSAAMSYI